MPAETNPLPILISVPHAGTAIPPALQALMQPHIIRDVPDTDWFVKEVYGFAPKMGIAVVAANYSRYVIDLNRSLQQTALYDDGRAVTGLFPEQTFAGEPIYRDTAPGEAEKLAYIEQIYRPYQQTLIDKLQHLQQQFPQVLLFDAHSIKRHVPRIYPDPIPDLILGDNGGRAAAPELTQTALTSLHASPYVVSHNHPFQGGAITRELAQPVQGRHVLQLEMAQDIYMDETQIHLLEDKLTPLQHQLRALLQGLADHLGTLR